VVARANSDLAALFDVDAVDDSAPGPSYNFAPSERIGVVLESGDPATRRLTGARWGLVPAFKRSPFDGPTPFNARIEKVTESGMYKPAFAKRRAIVPVDGFYERRKADDTSFYIHPPTGDPLALAALYEWWRDKTLDPGDPHAWLLSATIITRPPQGKMPEVHDREPLYLAPDLWADWLDPARKGDYELLGAATAASTAISEGLDFRRIGAAWKATTPGRKLDGPELIEPAD
jgi:putative SOS response-associated peptidase YedK